MESKRINWKRILKSAIAGIGFTLACLLISIFAFMPLTKVNAKEWTLSAIKDKNIHFVAAKTKVRSASSYTWKNDFADKNNNNYTAFSYNYDDSTVNYYKTTKNNTKLDEYSSNDGNIKLSTNDDLLLKTFDSIVDYPSSQKDYIPHNAEYFYNSNNQNYENVFYDEIGENDFVLLDNYESHQEVTYKCEVDGILTSDDINLGKCKTCGNKVIESFNVENIYLSFGAPDTRFNNKQLPDTKLVKISSVSGWLYTETQVHELDLVKPIPYQITELDGTDTNDAHYWYQYLDLRNLLGKSGQKIYNINEQQGKYVFTFEFAVFDDDLTVEESANESFTFEFYLLDGKIYDNYPEINTNGSNADYINQGLVREHYYNYNKENPTLTYDPTKYNLTYTRENREIVDTTTTTFTRNYFTNNSITNNIVDVITFNTKTVINGDTTQATTSIKNLYVLSYRSGNILEYLYLSDNNATPLASGLKFEDDTTVNTDDNNYTYKVNNGDLAFEYKISKVLTKIDETYTINTYKSYSKDYINWGTYNSSNKVNTETYTNTYTSQELNKAYTINDLDYMLDPNKIPDGYNYIIEFDKQGIYDFSYNYAINVQQITNNLSPDNTDAEYAITNVVNRVRPSTSSDTANYSSNLLTPTMIGLNYDKYTPTTPTQVEGGALKITSWSYLTKEQDSETYKATINGIEYTYTPADNKITTANSTINLTNNYATGTTLVDLDLDAVTNDDQKNIGTEYKIIGTPDVGDIKLEVIYTFGTYAKYETTTTWTNNDQKIIQSKTITEEIYTLNPDAIAMIGSQELKEHQDSAWINICQLLEYMNNSPYTSSQSKLEKNTPIMNADKLHMFGSTAYFNKADPTSDTGYAELKLVNKNTNENFVSDVTRYYTGTTPAAKFSESIENLENMIITTDMASVFWRNYSSLLYDGKISKSYIYKYNNYSWKNNKVVLGALDTSFSTLYTKDIRVGVEDGLYEVIVWYNYDDYKFDAPNAPKTEFYQLFTFIISRKTPSISIKLYDEISETYSLDFSSANSDKYTNKNVEISWPKPTYFQYDIFVKINKSSYHNDYSSYNYSTKYSKNNFYNDNSSIVDMSNYIIDATSDNEKVYRLRIIGDHTTNQIMGKYKATIYCGPSQAAATSKNFIVDKEQISGTKIIPIVQNQDGTYKTTIDATGLKTYNSTNQIVNYDFTFRYDRKKSKANIKTYWYKIDLTQASKYDELLNLTSTSEQAITTNFEVNGTNLKSIESRNPYNYYYDEGTFVANNNTFADINSAIYLFTMEDEAGNTCRYVVFYDTTTPRFILTPTLNNTHNIINETTKMTWGDYKAIAIKTNSYNFDLSLDIDNYTKLIDNEGNPLSVNKIQEAISYINSNTGLFKDIKIQYINNSYYLLLPINQVTVTDRNAKPYGVDNTTNLTNSVTYTADTILPNEFYFIAKANPITTSTEGQITKTYIELINKNKVEINADPKYTRVQLTKDGSIINRFIQTSGANQIFGSLDKGEFDFTIYDNQGNATSGYLWMNLDKTQTLAYALFNTKDSDISSKNAVDLTGEDGSYSASKLFISSLEPSKSVPQYSLTYKYYQYDPEFYEDLNQNYTISTVKIVDKNSPAEDIPTNITITGLEQYLVLTYKLNSRPQELKYVSIQITDESGEDAPNHSYPYDLQGTAIISNANGPEHIYSNNKADYSIQEGTKDDPQKRIFSTCINQVSDGKNYVTQEGLYIFKRSYTKTNGNYINSNGQVITDGIGDDDDIIYLVYYIDRSGIINVTAMNSIAEALYNNSAENLGFILGSNYEDESLKKFVDPNTIKNNLSPYSTTTTNSNSHSKHTMKTTNKVQVEFNLMADKYNFSSFIHSFYKNYGDNVSTKTRIADIINENPTLTNYVENYLFNQYLYTYDLYKLNLTLKIGNQNIIDESQTAIDKIFDPVATGQYLYNTDYKSNNAETINQRNTSLTLYKGTTNDNKYHALITDSSGYEIRNGATVLSKNNLANELDIDFNILHTAPTGEAYGKYYGEDNYDENRDNNALDSIPYDSEGLYNNAIDNESRYRLLEKYLAEGKLKLDPLTSIKSTNYDSANKTNVSKLYSTNNETLIFTFAITPDEYNAQIDPSKITIHKDGAKIFEVNGYTTKDDKTVFNFVGNDSAISTERMESSYIWNKVDGIMYFAIIIFDNNLDTILDSDEYEQNFLKYRLLDPLPKGNNGNLANSTIYNTDNATYSIKISYIGNESNYIDDNSQYFASSTYEIKIDRNKPTYNLAKLMSLDKYKYNPDKVDPNTITDYTSAVSAYNSYLKYYNFEYDKDYDIYRSDLENYFFAVDYRPGSTFSFECIDIEDNNKGIYIRKIDDINNYKFSRTQDDYLAYYESANVENTDLINYPQFSTINATTVQLGSSFAIDSDYYYIPLSLYGKSSLSMQDLVNGKLIATNSYYEIIETDEAGNFRVYGIYVPDYTQSRLQYSYKLNAESEPINNAITYDNNAYIEINGISFKLNTFQTTDKFLKASIKVTSKNVNETTHIYYDPVDMCIKITNNNNQVIKVINDIPHFYKKEGVIHSSTQYTDEFIKAINDLIEKYNTTIKDTNGYNLTIEIVDRIGLPSSYSTKINSSNYLFNYNVAGAELVPQITDYQKEGYFKIVIPAKNGTTNIVKVRAYIFKNGWTAKDPDDGAKYGQSSNSFYKSEKELLDGETYYLGKGVYKFEITDNFNRTQIIFHEIGTSSTQAGGTVHFNGPSMTYTDGYKYTSQNIDFVFDGTSYNIYIGYIGETLDGNVHENKANPDIIYSTENPILDSELRAYGMSLSTIDGLTTLSITGVNDISKYFIKTVPAKIVASFGYNWGDELTNKNIMVYDNKLALYNLIQTPVVKNLNGIELDTKTQLNLTEDFELSLKWSNTIPYENRIDFNSKIILTRTYLDSNNMIRTEEISNSNKYTITKPGDYTAQVYNALGTVSERITFTRGDGEISMYNVVNVNKIDNKYYNKQNIKPSTIVNKESASEDEVREIIIFNYFTTEDYFSFIDSEGVSIKIEDLEEEISEVDEISINKKSSKYLDVVVNSNLSIYIQISAIGKDASNNGTPFVQFRIYSKVDETNTYTYRFLKVYFLPATNYSIVETMVYTELNTTDNIYSGTDSKIKRPDNNLIIRFIPLPNSVVGNTIYISRYYNNKLIETISHDSTTSAYELLLNGVGLHTFVVKDLAGRTQTFGTVNSDSSLQIYLINQIIFTVNDDQPINKQYFNGEVNIKILTEISSIPLYSLDTLGITGTKDGVPLDLNNSGEMKFTQPGYYSIKMVTTTKLADGNSHVADQEITTVYNFTIVRDDIAKRSFTVSNGDGFVIEKIIKNVNGQKTDVTNNYTAGDSLLLLTHEKEGNSKFVITLKSYDHTIKEYRSFSFNVWINNDIPIIRSNVLAGTSTKDTIELNFNPGKIYEQVGKAYIRLNDSVYMIIDENSEDVVKTIKLNQKGEYYFEIVSEDGRVFSSYNFEKQNPINKTTKIVLISLGAAAVVVVIAFFLIRRKGKYR